MIAAAAAPPAPPSLLVFLLQMALLLLAALLLGGLARRLGMPSIVGELCAGVVLGPTLLGSLLPSVEHWLFPPDVAQRGMLDAIAQIGVLLMVGVTGAHLDTSFLRSSLGSITRISGFGLMIPLTLGIGFGLLPIAQILNGTEGASVLPLFLGVAMCVSAIPVIAKTLMDLGLLHHRIGQLTIAAGVIDDTVGWVLLSVIGALTLAGGGSDGVVRAVVGVAIVLAVTVSVARPLVRTVFRLADRSPSSAPTSLSFVVLILLAAAGSQALGLEALLGAVMCGMVIGTAGRPDPEKIAPLNSVVIGVLAPLFFATAGLKMDLTLLLGSPALMGVAALLLAIAIVGKFVGAYVGARTSRLSRWEGLALGAAMNARGAVEIVVATVGLQLGVLNQAAYTIIVLIAIATSLIAPPIMRFALLRTADAPSAATPA